MHELEPRSRSRFRRPVCVRKGHQPVIVEEPVRERDQLLVAAPIVPIERGRHELRARLAQEAVEVHDLLGLLVVVVLAHEERGRRQLFRIADDDRLVCAKERGYRVLRHDLRRLVEDDEVEGRLFRVDVLTDGKWAHHETWLQREDECGDAPDQLADRFQMRLLLRFALEDRYLARRAGLVIDGRFLVLDRIDDLVTPELHRLLVTTIERLDEVLRRCERDLLLHLFEHLEIIRLEIDIGERRRGPRLVEVGIDEPLRIFRKALVELFKPHQLGQPGVFPTQHLQFRIHVGDGHSTVDERCIEELVDRIHGPLYRDDDRRATQLPGGGRARIAVAFIGDREALEMIEKPLTVGPIALFRLGIERVDLPRMGDQPGEVAAVPMIAVPLEVTEERAVALDQRPDLLVQLVVARFLLEQRLPLLA